MPRPAEIEVEECAAPNGSYSLSARRVKPERPPSWRSVRMRSRRPVRDLVRIGLVADIPDQPVFRRVEDIVQRHRQFDDAKAGAKMAARVRNGIDQLGAQLRGQLRQLAFVKLLQVGRNADLVEKRRMQRCVHCLGACCS